jgi:putative ABC transport system substrate-binding protein
MRRREFVAGVGACAVLGARGALGQQAIMPVVGFLSGGSPVAFQHFAAAFARGLSENGYGPGRVAIEHRWAEGQTERLPSLAVELVRARVSVIGAGGPPAALAAKAATATIPIVFTSGEDPVKLGLVASYNRPGGTVTGIAALIDVLGAKRLGLLRELAPSATDFVALLDPKEPSFNTQSEDLKNAARSAGVQVHLLRASSADEIDAAFASAKQLHAGGLLVGISFLLTQQREKLATLAARDRLPTIYGQREFMTAGGLMSYGTDLSDAYFRAGAYVAAILKGTSPGSLPVTQSAKFELIINVKTAKALGLTFPSGIISIADEVFE